MASVWGELKRRNVVRVAVAYAIVSWLILQLTDVLMPLLSLPEWVGGLVFLLLVVGFLLALILSWAYELTPEGVKKERDVDRSDSVTRVTGRKLDFFIIAALSLALVFVVIDQYVLEEPAPAAEVSENLRSIAVLPFTNRSAEEENAAFFADGVHDELLTRLSKIGDLKVISRTSVMEYRDTTKNMRQIGDELGVGSILEGGVQRAGDRVRINVQLIDAQTDEHLWAEIYERELNTTNIFSIQSEISIAIAKALRATLTPDEQERLAAVPTGSMKALEEYFVGKQLVQRRGTESLLASMDHFQTAIDLDPDFALAYSGLAEAWLELPNYKSGTDSVLVRSESEAATHKAVSLDPNSPAALATLGWLRLLYNYDWEGAEEAFRHALDVAPTNVNALHWLSHLLSWQGKHEEAIEFAERALEVDPLSLLIRINLSYIHMDARNWETAFRLRDELTSPDALPALTTDSWVGKLRAESAEDAAAALRVWATVTGRSVEAAEEMGAEFIRFQHTGEPIQLSDDLIARLEIGLSELPEVYASVDDAERTIAALQRAYHSAGARSLLSMKINPSYDFVRDDPRFVELLEQIGLAE
jgi:TolB-like protein